MYQFYIKKCHPKLCKFTKAWGDDRSINNLNLILLPDRGIV
jgi:hypothetical protein